MGKNICIYAIFLVILHRKFVCVMYSNEEQADILLSLLAKPAETEIVEFKRAKNSFSDTELGQYFSALSNEANLKGEAYAWLVFGVDNTKHELTDTQYKPSRPALDEMKKKIGDQTTNRITFEEIYDLTYQGKRVVMFQIPAAPQGIPIAYQGHYYGRDGESLVALNLQEIERIRSQRADNSFEMRPAKSGLTSSEVLQYLNYKKLYERIDRRVPREESAILDLLKEYAYITEDHSSWAITNMGALLFANRLTDFENLRFRGLILRRYEGNNNLVMINERHSEAGYAVEFDDLLDWLENNTSKEKIISSRTREITYPRVAMREFMANVMVHQDFSITGMPLTIEIFGNRIVFTNPGSLLNDANRLIDLPPHSRNETLAQAMLQVDLCERRGSGYDRAVEGIESMCLPPYKVETGDNFTRVTIYQKKNISDMSKLERIQACYQHVCLMYENTISVTNTSIRERFGLDAHKSATVSHIISDTINANLIKVENPSSESRKFASYIPYYA